MAAGEAVEMFLNSVEADENVLDIALFSPTQILSLANVLQFLNAPATAEFSCLLTAQQLT